MPDQIKHNTIGSKALPITVAILFVIVAIFFPLFLSDVFRASDWSILWPLLAPDDNRRLQTYTSGLLVGFLVMIALSGLAAAVRHQAWVGLERAIYWAGTVFPIAWFAYHGTLMVQFSLIGLISSDTRKVASWSAWLFCTAMTLLVAIARRKTVTKGEVALYIVVLTIGGLIAVGMA